MDSAFSDCLYRCFESLPRCKDDFFLKLWHGGIMRYGGETNVFDTIDELSARLVCAAISSQKQSLIILPDSDFRRPAALFSSALIMSYLDAKKAGVKGGCILYFGTKLGIRSHLADISVRYGTENVTLSSVFAQYHGRGNVLNTQAISDLPHVICIYSPLDPVELVASHRPRWIALDCNESSSYRWVKQLLPYIKENRLPLIAWSSNPLSSIKKEFRAIEANIFEWPPLLIHPELKSKRSSDVGEVLRALSEPIPTVDIVPCILTGSDADIASNHLSQAQRYLAEGMTKAEGRIERDALLVGWKYLRALERLIIPLDLFEEEALHYWGVRPLSQIKNVFDRFISTLSTTSSLIIDILESAKHNLDSTLEMFQERYPPRWEALIELCLEKVPENYARLLIFSGSAQKSMFTYALLARLNTSDKDLAQMRVFLKTFSEATTLLTGDCSQKKSSAEDSESLDNLDNDIMLPHDIQWNLIHVTLPSQYQSDNIVPFLGLKQFEILLYPYQINALSRKISEWESNLDINVPNLSKVFGAASEKELLEVKLEKRTIVKMSAVRVIEGNHLPQENSDELRPIWKPKPEVEEVAFLFSNKDDDTVLSDHDIIDQEDEPNSKEAVVEKALQVCFADGWRGTFDVNARLNVVKTTQQGNKIESCYIKALRKGDRILYIYGQKRQSLYELVLSRVHSHPSMEIHLALVRQWQFEIRQAFIRWLQNGKSLYELYSRMRELGTDLEGPYQLRSWIAGFTIRPSDIEDLRRISEILGMSFTLEHYKRIHKAGGRIHGLHISLSRRLNAWIQQGASDARLPDDIIDETTGLTFSDVRDSLILLTVESFMEKEGPFDRSSLNKIKRET
jgi:hypothetical protein